MQNKRVLVTGGSGFIGSHLIERLLRDGAHVAVLVRYGNVVKNERLAHCWDKLAVIEGDLRNRGALAAVLDYKPEYVFHLAAYNHVGESFRQVEECFDVNAKGSANLVDVCQEAHSLLKFVYVSTSEVYGHQPSVPFVESMTPEPISPYAITKYAGELYCRMKQRIAGSMPIVVVRPFNVFGPYQSSKAVIPEIVLKCLHGEDVNTTKGEQTREFNFVGNLVDGLLTAALHDKPVEGPVNIGAGEEVAICDLIRTIARLTETKAPINIGALPYRPTEIWRMRADCTRAKELWNWKPRVSLEDGLKQTIAWFKRKESSR
jgi:nucleoside-diphosphate-sugar epimerase